MNTLSRRSLLGAGALCAVVANPLALTQVHAQGSAYPNRPITLIVPYPPGGTADMAARTMAQAMEPFLKQTVVVENRPGASGNIGMGAVKRAAPDGYTLGLGTVNIQTINQYLYSDMPFDPEVDFAPLHVVLMAPTVIAVRQESPLRSMQDLYHLVQSREQPVSYASPGVATSMHLTGEYLGQVLGKALLHVPFKGVANAMPAVIGGQVDVLMDNVPSTLGQLVATDARLRALAVSSAERLAALPDVPTIAESGGALQDFSTTSWFALYAPAGTPAAAQETVIAAAKQALATQAVQTQFARLGGMVGTLAGADLVAFEAQERVRWRTLIQDLKLSVN